MTDLQDTWKATCYGSLHVAKLYAQLGWRVFPVNFKSRPYLRNWPELATTDLDTIESWFGEGGLYQDADVAIATGRESGIWATDLDVKNGPNGIEAFERLVQEHGEPLPETLVVETPSGGRHLLWAYPDEFEIKTDANVGAEGVDTRGWHGYIVAPFMVRVKGTYAPLKGSQFAEDLWAMADGEKTREPLLLPRAPHWWEEMATRRGKSEWSEEGEYATESLGTVEVLIEHASEVSAGGQEEYLFKLLCKLRGQNRSPEEMAEIGWQVASRFQNVAGHDKGDWSLSNVEYKVRHVCEKYPAGSSRDWELDAGLLTYLQELSGATARTAPENDAVAERETATSDETGSETTVDGLEPVNRFPSLDWASAFEQDFSQIDYLPGRFMERGQQVALVGGGKVGKSVFIQEWAYRCVAGLPFLGSEPCEPLKILYFDRENNLRDIVLRMRGFGATPQTLASLDYRLFPSFSGQLDQSVTAASELLAIVTEVQPDIVILDTVSRFISGNENDADTWLSLYRAVHVPLKARGVACVRLDHMGKDEERGSRGSSAKTQDVDHVWELTKTSEHRDPKTEPGVELLTTGLRLKRTHSRTGLGEDFLQITRHGAKDRTGMWISGRTGHALTGVGGGEALDMLADQNLTVAELADILDRLEVPSAAGERVARKALTESNIKAKTEKLREAIKMRRGDQSAGV